MGVVDRISLDGIVYDTIDSNGRALIAYPEATGIASKDYSAGDFFILNNKLYAATDDIEEGAAFDTQTNCRQSTGVMDEIVSPDSPMLLPPGGAWGKVLTKASSDDYDAEWLQLNLGYVTPEQYGASGTGVTDDTAAIQTCIAYASSQGYPVRGYGTYKTTSTINIIANYLDLFINDIQYTGSSNCISISGAYNNIRFTQLYCSNGSGVLMYKPQYGSCYRNKISAMTLYSKYNSVEFDSNGGYILYNTFDIRDIKSDLGDCYHGDTRTVENVFMNSTCACASGWAIYNCQGRFYDFTLEGDVLNGIYIGDFTGSSYYAGFRIRELVDKVVRRINGTELQAEGGIILKYVGDCGYTKFVCEDPIPYDAIDVSEMYTPEEALEEYEEASSSEKSELLSKIAHLAWYHEIDAPIRYGNWDTYNGYYVLGKKMIVHGGRKICIPYQQSEYTITNQDYIYDMSDTESAENNGKIYPTKFIIGADSCEIYLPSSYCCSGYSEFIVDQTQHTCTIYDYNDTTTPMFDGATAGTGMYRFRAYTDLDNDVIYKAIGEHKRFFDGSNYKWEVEKLGSDGLAPSATGVTF